MSKFLSYAYLILVVALLIGCTSQTRFISDEGADSDWNRAKSLFERERYYKASQLLRDITLNYSGSAFIDSAYYYLALSGFEQQDYFVAADDFRRLVQQFPSSHLAGNAAYFEARCNYEMAPDYRLDQTFTEQAFDEFQRYLEDYPQNEFADSAYTYMGKCRDKLAEKRYMALKLYLRLQEYASAVIYSDAILSDFYDTKYADEAAFEKVRSLVKLKESEKAVAAVADYKRRFPDGKFLQRIISIESSLHATEDQAAKQ
ncbi:MAG: outer membrane protein assembly factor BamD [Calditrichaeota bacterium]|nr:outer membrane protein assembly factor BamD [Calditrichota bacterium]MCB9367821.1 outer membrane protein assembly factor BamD [Calditrichota bacterium]